MSEAVAPSADEARRIGQMLSDPSLGSLMHLQRIDVEPGSLVYDAETPARSLYFIHSGQVRVFQVGWNESARLIEILGPDDWFGVPALAKAAVYGTRAVAVTRALLSQISVDLLGDVLAHHPAISAELIGQLALKVEAAHADAANLVFHDTKDRLVRTLLQFSRTAAATRVEGGDGGVVLHITHQQLAQAVGAARETVSLTLTQLRHQNLLRTGRNRLSFHPEALEQFSRRTRSVEPETVP